MVHLNCAKILSATFAPLTATYGYLVMEKQSSRYSTRHR
ncbi:MAG: hypothetical protein ACI915_005400, partial [Gammaproteobacteria bacterium]